jgi:hypothetical protein
MKRIVSAAAILLLAGAPASAHRLDEYLQGTLLSVSRSRMEAQMTLTPGVAVFPLIMAEIDTDASGAISPAEQQAYAARVLRELALSSDGERLVPRLTSASFPTIEEMREGRGEIQLNFSADLPSGGRNRILTLENRHQTRISAYQVNSLVPKDPDIRIEKQIRNYSQSVYRLEYRDTAATRSRPMAWLAWLAAAALLLCMRVVFLRSQTLSRRATVT